MIEAHALEVDGPLPAIVREHYPCFDIPLAPPGAVLTPWSAADAARWMANWPPSDGELYAPLDIWDDELATLWLDRHRPIETAPTSNLILFRQRRSSQTALQVLAGLDDDDLLVLTDSVLCERLRRQVLAPLLTARAETIRIAARRVGAGGMTLAAARRSLHAHDAHRDAYLQDAFADADEWIGEWVVDLSVRLFDLFVWPAGFSVSELADLA